MKQKDKEEIEQIRHELIGIKTRLKVLKQKEYNNLLNVPNSFQNQQSKAIYNETLIEDSVGFIDDIIEQLGEIE